MSDRKKHLISLLQESKNIEELKESSLTILKKIDSFNEEAIEDLIKIIEKYKERDKKLAEGKMVEVYEELQEDYLLEQATKKMKQSKEKKEQIEKEAQKEEVADLY